MPLVYRTWGATSQPPLLLLHGFMGCAEDWDRIAQALSSEFYCIAPDLPGHGQSPFIPAYHGHFEGYADAVISLLDSLGHESVAAIGYSMGGRLLLALALRHPQRFSSTIMESASPGIANDDAREARRESDHALARRLQQDNPLDILGGWYAQPLFGAIKQSDGYSEMLKRRLRNDPHQLALALEACGTGQQDSLWDKLPFLKPDTLLIYGAHDQTYKAMAAEMQQRNQNLISAAIWGSSHAAHVENPKQFIDICRPFLTNHRSGELSERAVDHEHLKRGQHPLV